MARFNRGQRIWRRHSIPPALLVPLGASATFVADAELSGTGALSYPATASLSASAAMSASTSIPASLNIPSTDVWIAFNPTSGATISTAYAQALPSPGLSNTYWTNVSKYLRDFTKHSGRQHQLDRNETGTITFTFNSRDGFFFNSTLNGTGAIIAPRLPIAMTETWAGVTYPKFFGLIDTAHEVVADQVNVDLHVEASDFLKQLSLRYMESPAFWATYVNSASAANYYSLAPTQTAVITYASNSGSTITYQAFNNLSAGDTVTITGLGIYQGASLNLVNVVVTTASSSYFTVTHSVAAGSISSGTGSAYRSRMVDSIGSNNALIQGTASFPNQGAIIYVSNACCDLANGSSKASGLIQFPTQSSKMGGMDFWILGQGIQNTLIVTSITTHVSGADYQVNLSISTSGNPQVSVPTLNSNVVKSPHKIDDGYWHHIGLVANSSGYLTLYVDGTFTSLTSAFGNMDGWKSSQPWIIGNTSSILGSPPMMIDEIVLSNTSSLSTLETEVKNRYRAGTLLQLPTNPAGTQVQSGDRIAEVLAIAGYGSIVNGAVVLFSNLYYINESATAWANGAPGNGYVNAQPWYWDAPIYNSTALDLIYQIVDTDIGSFYQHDDGTFAFHTQAFYGNWVWNSSTNTGVWHPYSYSPTPDHTWADDGSGYPYDPSSLQLDLDDTDLWTAVRITPQAGTDQVYENTSGQAQYGYTTLVKSGTLHTSLNLALSTANYLGHLFRSPLARTQSVKLLSATKAGANNSALLSCRLGDVVKFTRNPPNATAAISQLMVVEAYDLEFNAEAGTMDATYVLDPYPIRS